MGELLPRVISTYIAGIVGGTLTWIRGAGTHDDPGHGRLDGYQTAGAAWAGATFIPLRLTSFLPPATIPSELRNTARTMAIRITRVHIQVYDLTTAVMWAQLYAIRQGLLHSQYWLGEAQMGPYDTVTHAGGGVIDMPDAPWHVASRSNEAIVGSIPYANATVAYYINWPPAMSGALDDIRLYDVSVAIEFDWWWSE